MKAKEMFERLGYTYNKYAYGIEIILHTKYENYKYIRFDFKNKTYCCVYECEPMDVDMETHMAIIQQIKELGW